MKKILIALVLFLAGTAFSQYKDPPFPTANIKDGIINTNSSSLFGFLNSDNFSMNQSISMSYSSFGNEGLAMGVYTNSMAYKFSNKLNVQADVSVVNSPYSSFGQKFQNNLNGIYLSKAAINYKPWDDVYITFQYRNVPNNYYSPYGYGYYGNSFYNGFDNDWDWRR